MKAAIATVAGRATGDASRPPCARRSGRERDPRQIELPNPVAAELAGAHDSILRALEGHLDCAVFLRGNVVTLEGEPPGVESGARSSPSWPS